jgi:hypothetical protein
MSHKRKHDTFVGASHDAASSSVFAQADSHIARVIASVASLTNDDSSSVATAIAQLRHWNRAGTVFLFFFLFCFDVRFVVVVNQFM